MTKTTLKRWIFRFTFITVIVSTPFDGSKLSTAAAQYFTGPQSRALGHTGRATLSGAESPFLNPAMLAHVKSFHLAGFINSSQITDVYTSKDVGGVFIDNNPEAVLPASISYVKRTNTFNNQPTTEEHYQVSFGRHLFEGFAFGLAGQYFKDLSLPDQPKTNWNGHLGIVFIPLPNLGFGVVKYNVITERLPQLKSAFGLGSHYLFEQILRLRGDVVYQDADNPEKQAVYMLGIETILRGELNFRFGYKADNLIKKSSYSVGFGWAGPKLAIDYAFEKNTQNQIELTHAIDLRLFF